MHLYFISPHALVMLMICPDYAVQAQKYRFCHKALPIHMLEKHRAMNGHISSGKIDAAVCACFFASALHDVHAQAVLLLVSTVGILSYSQIRPC